MARMIPPLISRDSTPGERLVFDGLCQDPATEGWVVLHAQDLAEQVRLAQGEADFVVIVPGRSVAVVEVTSHTRVAHRSDGMWGKVSFHTAIAAGTATTLGLVFGPWLYLSWAMVGAIAWARVKLAEHTPARQS